MHRSLRTSATVRVVAIDPHPMILRGLSILFGESPLIELVGTASDGAAGLALIEELKPAVVLTEIALPDMAGSELIRAVLAVSPSPAVVVFSSTHSTMPSAFNAARAGAKGYVSKETDLDAVITTITLVAKGFTCLPEHSLPDVKSRLSSRETEVMQALLGGMNNRTVAAKLGINEKTVSHYKCTAMKKLKVTSLAVLAGMDVHPW
ncbi:MAG: response regulator transcription factor [Rhodocyclaceae bacterium]